MEWILKEERTVWGPFLDHQPAWRSERDPSVHPPASSGPTPFIHRSILTAVPPLYRKRQFSPWSTETWLARIYWLPFNPAADLLVKCPQPAAARGQHLKITHKDTFYDDGPLTRWWFLKQGLNQCCWWWCRRKAGWTNDGSSAQTFHCIAFHCVRLHVNAFLHEHAGWVLQCNCILLPHGATTYCWVLYNSTACSRLFCE